MDSYEKYVIKNTYCWYGVTMYRRTELYQFHAEAIPQLDLRIFVDCWPYRDILDQHCGKQCFRSERLAR